MLIENKLQRICIYMIKSAIKIQWSQQWLDSTSSAPLKQFFTFSALKNYIFQVNFPVILCFILVSWTLEIILVRTHNTLDPHAWIIIRHTLFVLIFTLSRKKLHLRAKISTEFTLKKAMREIWYARKLFHFI